MDQPTQVPAQIKEPAEKPQGLLPKNVQSWLLVGLACLMVGIMWLTGGKKTDVPGKPLSASAPTQAPIEVNETKIAELQSRIEDLQRQQLVAQNALAQQTRLLGNQNPDPQQAQSQPAATPVTDSKAEDPIEAQRKTLFYQSLFASNIAVTYRKPVQQGTEGVQAPAASVQTQPDDAQLSQLLRDMQQAPVIPAASTQRPTIAAAKPEPGAEVHPKSDPPAPLPLDRAGGKSYLLLEGTILETVLINRLDGQFAGSVECLVSSDVYSNDRQHLLIPSGSKVLGETRKVDTFGESRLAVVFHRLLMPDGYSVSLDQFAGLNQIGDTGLRDQVNNHYLRIFGVSMAIGAIGAVAEGGTADSLAATSTDLMRQGFAESTAQSSAQILDKFLNILPTVTIREGHRVKVVLSNDLALPDYNNHQIPSNF
jgi:type IV secretory pathway VirB10-like protein